MTCRSFTRYVIITCAGKASCHRLTRMRGYTWHVSSVVRIYVCKAPIRAGYYVGIVLFGPVRTGYCVLRLLVRCGAPQHVWCTPRRRHDISWCRGDASQRLALRNVFPGSSVCDVTMTSRKGCWISAFMPSRPRCACFPFCVCVFLFPRWR